MLQPTTVEEASAIVREQADAHRTIRPRGGGTKLGWARPANATEMSRATPVDLDTRGLNRVLEHNAGDFTAVLEAGVTLASAQAVFAATGQMLALDPPLGDHAAATIGGVLATNDSGPLRHRYGSGRDLVLGATVVLSDGRITKSGGTVIKNVAGYDLGKLFVGSFGTLGLIVRVAVRLHPLPATTASVVGTSDDPDRLAAAVAALSKLPLEAECLDILWSNGSGQLLLRFAGAAAAERAQAAAGGVVGLKSVETVIADGSIWARQRALQRATPSPDVSVSRQTCVLKVSGRPTDLPRLLRAADEVGATVVSRAVLGISWITLSAADVGPMRLALAPRSCTVLDGADQLSDPWPAVEPSALAVMRRIKAHFDPGQVFSPGCFVGGI